MPVVSLHGSKTMAALAKHTKTPYLLLLLHDTQIDFGQFAIERFLRVAEETGAGMVFADYFDMKEGKRTPIPSSNINSAASATISISVRWC